MLKSFFSLKLFIVVTVIFFSVKAEDLFPRKIWIYWDKPIENADYLVRLFYQKFVDVCERQKWQLTLLNKQNIRQYIDDYQNKVQKVLKNAKLLKPQNFADLIRLSVLQSQGGVYFDISSILTNGLEWIQTLDQHPYLVTNRKKGIKPDMLVPYISYYQSTTQYRGEQKTIINPEPGYEIWFIAAKAKSPAIQQWQSWYSWFYQRQLDQNLQTYNKDDIFIKGTQFRQYFTANKAIYYFIQKQQFQLDKFLNLLTPYRQDANQFYKIWGFHGQFGPLIFTMKFVLQQEYMFQKTLEQFKEQYIDIKFYVKLTLDQRQEIKKYLGFQFQLNERGLDFQKFMQQKPISEQCKNVIFPIKDSVIGKLLENNKLADQLKLFVISKQQHQRWKSYCRTLKQKFQNNHQSQQKSFQTKILNFVMKWFKPATISSISKNYQTRIYERQLSLSERLYVVYKNNQLMLKAFMPFCFVMVVLCSIGSFLSNLFLKVIKAVKGQQIEYSQHHNQNLNQEKRQSIHRQGGQIEQLKGNDLVFAVLLLTYIINMINFQIFNEFGDRHSDTKLFVLLIWTWLFRRYTSNKINQNAITFIGLKLNEFTSIFDPLICYELGKQVLSWTQIRCNNLYPDTIVICVIYPCLLKLVDRISRSSSLEFLSIFVKIQQHHFKIVVSFMVICMITNLRYLTSGQQYFIKIVSKFLIYYTCLLFFSLICQLIYDLYKQLHKLLNPTSSFKPMSSQDKRLLARTTTAMLYLIGIVFMYKFTLWIRVHYLHLMMDQMKFRLDFSAAIYGIFFSLSLLHNFKYKNYSSNGNEFLNSLYFVQTAFTHTVLIGYTLGLVYFEEQIMDSIIIVILGSMVMLITQLGIVRYRFTLVKNRQTIYSKQFISNSSESIERESLFDEN